jgi:hypothetical protein
VQYTIRNIPPATDTALRRRARQEGKSLNRVIVDTLAGATGTTPRGSGPPYFDIDEWARNCTPDPELAAILAEMHDEAPIDDIEPIN